VPLFLLYLVVRKEHLLDTISSSEYWGKERTLVLVLFDEKKKRPPPQKEQEKERRSSVFFSPMIVKGGGRCIEVPMKREEWEIRFMIHFPKKEERCFLGRKIYKATQTCAMTKTNKEAEKNKSVESGVS